MNELSQRYIDDCLQYTPPEGRDERKKILTRVLEEYGEVVRIEDFHDPFFPERIYKRHYHTARGGDYMYVLSAAREGVRNIGDPPPPGFIHPVLTKEYCKVSNEYRRMFGDERLSWATFPGGYDDRIEVMKQCIADGKPYVAPVSAVP